MLELRFRGDGGRELKRVLETKAKLSKKYGPLAQDFQDRISELRSVSSLSDYLDTPLGQRVQFKALTGNLEGSYSITVQGDHAIRLVITPTITKTNLAAITGVYVEVIDDEQ